MAWKCAICLLVFTLTLRTLLQHINRNHAASPNFHIICGINQCPREYTRFHSFYKHVRKTHYELWNLTTAEAEKLTGSITIQTNCTPVADDVSLENFDENEVSLF